MQKEFPSDVTYFGDINGTLTVRMDYIELPILAQYVLPSEDRVGLTVRVVAFEIANDDKPHS